MSLTLGKVGRFTYALTVAGTPTNATVALTVTAPDGATSTPAVANPTTGNYTADLLLDQVGAWTYEWAASGAVTDTEIGEFEVLALDSDISMIRLLINDLALPQTFDDTEIASLLAFEGDSVRLAAAQALDVLASNESLVKQRIKTLDLQTDGPAVAKDLREHAQRLRTQSAAEIELELGGEFEFTTGMGTPELVEHETCWPY